MSIAVRVQLLSIYRTLAGGEAERAERLAEGATVGDLLTGLSEAHGPAFRRALWSKDGGLNAQATVLLNGENVALGQGLESVLGEGDVVTVLLAMTGG